jgi:hypothetical protein
MPDDGITAGQGAHRLLRHVQGGLGGNDVRARNELI